MVGGFDPYHKWLAIPAKEQPAHHYRLLGIPLFESDPDVIESGADQRMSHVRTFATSEHGDRCEAILREIQIAKLELLDPKKKLIYDKSLRAKLAGRKEQGRKQLRTRSQGRNSAPTEAKGVRQPNTKSADAFAIDTSVATRLPHKTARGRNTRSWKLPVTLLGVGVSLTLILLLVLLNSSGGPPTVESGDKPAAMDQHGTPGKVAQSNAQDAEETRPNDVKVNTARSRDSTPDNESPEIPSEKPTPAALPPLAPALGEPVDLLAMIDVVTHRAKGEWRKTDGALESAAGKVSILTVPFEPPAEYDLSLVVERTSGDNGLFVGLVADKRHFEVVLDGKPNGVPTSGIDVVDGQRYVGNETTIRGHSIDAGNPVTIICQVRHNRLVVKQDDQIVLDWQADYQRCAAYDEWSTEHPEWLAIGSFKSGFRISTVECRPLSASAAQPLPPKSEPPLASKRPVPTADEQQAVVTQLREIYDFDQERTPADLLRLADELIKLAQQPGNKVHATYVLLVKAGEVAAAAGDAGRVFAAEDLIDKEFEVDVLQRKYDRLKDISSSARGEEQIEIVLQAAKALVRQAIERDRIDTAQETIDLAFVTSQKGASRELRKETLERQREIRELHKRWQVFQAAKQQLETAADDSEANRVAGSWYAFERGSWDTGLPLLAKGDNPAWKDAAQKELAAREGDTKVRLAAADAWWQLAGEDASPQANAMRLHAAECYRAAIAEVSSSLVKVRLEKRLAEADQIERPLGHLAASAVVPPLSDISNSQRTAETTDSLFAVGEWGDLLPLVEPRRHGVVGNWRRSGEGVYCGKANHSTLLIPLELEGSYDLQFEFTRISGDDTVGAYLPVGSRTCQLILSGWHGECHGIGNISGQQANVNTTSRRPGGIINGQEYKVDIQVRVNGEQGSIKVLLNDEPLTEWQGNVRDLSLGQKWPGYVEKRLALRTWNVVSYFHRAALRLVDGHARPLGPNDPDGRQDFLLTKTLGGSAGGPYREFAPQGFYAVGMRAWSAEVFSKPTLRGFQLLYSNGNEEREGNWFGQRGSFQEAKAKAGYALGGIIVEPTGMVRGVKLLFMRIKGDRLDPEDTYESPWLGTHGASVQQFIGGVDVPVIGVTGRKGSGIDALGLITAAPPDSPTFSVGKFSTTDGLQFIGWPEHVQTPLTYDGTTPITIETVVTPRNVNYERHDTTVIGNLQSSGVGIAIERGFWSFFWHGPVGWRKAVSDQQVEINKTVHVAGVYDGRQLRLYVDGKLQAGVVNVSGLKHRVSKYRFMVGSDPNPEGKPEHSFVGMIHRARISSAALYTSPFAVVGDLRSDRRTTVLLYKFDEGGGTLINDQSGGNLHGTLFGGTWLSND